MQLDFRDVTMLEEEDRKEEEVNVDKNKKGDWGGGMQRSTKRTIFF